MEIWPACGWQSCAPQRGHGDGARHPRTHHARRELMMIRGGNASKSLLAGVVRLALLLSLVVVSGSGVRADPVLTHVNVYVANANNNTVSVIEAATNTITTTVPVGPAPVAL